MDPKDAKDLAAQQDLKTWLEDLDKELAKLEKEQKERWNIDEDPQFDEDD